MTPKEHARITKKLDKLMNDVTDLVVLIGHIHPTKKATTTKAKKAKPNGPKGKSKGKSKVKPKATVKKGAAKPKKAQATPKERQNVHSGNVFLTEYD